MLFWALIASLAAVIFNLTLPLMAGVYIVGDLGGSNYIAPYGVAFFCLGNIITLPLGKSGATKLSAAQMYVVCLVLMIICSFLCFNAQYFFTFVLFRFLEGCASGPLYILITSELIPQLVPERNPKNTMPIILTTFAITPVIGASFGGWVAYEHDWRLLFLNNIPVCCFFLAYIGIPNWHSYPAPPKEKQLDLISFILYGLGVGFVGASLFMGQQLDWFRSPIFNKMLTIGILGSSLFFLRSWGVKNPIIDFKPFNNLYFVYGVTNVLFFFSAYFGMVVLLSLWLKLYVNYTPYWIALILATMLLGAWIPYFVVNKSPDPRYPLFVALLFLVISCFYTSYFDVEVNFGRIALSRVLAGLGLMLFLPPLFRLSVHTEPPERMNECSNIFHIVRLIGSALGVTLYVTLWQRRQVFYYERLGESFSHNSSINNWYWDKMTVLNIPKEKAILYLNKYLEKKSTALALDDCFYLMGYLMLGLLIILVLSYIKEPKITFNR